MSAGAKRRRQHARFRSGAGNQCLGKLRYRANQDAKRAIEQHDGFTRAYKCKICHHLHLTSKPKNIKEKHV